MINQKKLLIRIVSIIFFIFFVNLAAMKFYWYSGIWWFDMPMHLLSGFWLGIMLMWYFPPKDLSFKSVFPILFGVLAFALCWEIFEISVDRSITGNSFNLLDTLSDLCFGLSGGMISLFYFQKRIMITEKNNV